MKGEKNIPIWADKDGNKYTVGADCALSGSDTNYVYDLNVLNGLIPKMLRHDIQKNVIIAHMRK